MKKRLLNNCRSIASSKWLPWLLLIILCLPAVFALTVPGFYGASDDIHVAWIYEMMRTLRTGQIPPRFVPDLSYGFGYPLFNFVFPLPYYLGAVFSFAGLSLVNSLKLVFGLSIVFSGLFMYGLLKDILGSFLGLAGAVMYVYTPYRAIDIYFRGDIGESVAFVFFPVVLLALSRLSKGSSSISRWIGIGGLGIAGLILSHNIAAYMFMSAAILFVIFMLFQSWSDRERFLSLLKRVTIMFLLGLAAASYFWVPAILDSRLVKYDTVFSYADNFPSVRQILAPYLPGKQAAPDPYGSQSFYLGTVGLVVVVMSLVFFIILNRKIKRRDILIFGWAVTCLFVSLFMMNYRSVFLWQRIPFLPYFQFPWRFLMLTTFLIPFLLVVVPKGLRRSTGIMLIFLSIATTFQLFKPHDFLLREDDYYLNRYIPEPVASEEYRLTKEEYLRLPVGTEERPEKNYPLLYPLGNVVEIESENLLKIKATTVATHQFWLNYSKYNFPGWVAYVNGLRVQVKSGRPFGQVSILVPKGRNRVEIMFEETRFKEVLDLASFGAILGLLFIAVRKEGTPHE